MDDLDAHIDDCIQHWVASGSSTLGFPTMRTRHGTVGAIARLVRTRTIQAGFTQLWEHGLLQWSLEAAVLKFPHYFDDGTCNAAQRTLRMVGFTVPESAPDSQGA